MPGGNTFKESPTVSVRHSPASHVNGEAKKPTEESDSAKWKSLTTSTVSSRTQEVGLKVKENKEGVTLDSDGFARPTLRPSEMPPTPVLPPCKNLQGMLNSGRDESMELG